VVYMSLFISVLNTCMSLIHKVPDQILRWLGQSPETSDVGQQMQEIKSAVSGASEKISSGMQQSSMPHHKYQPKGEGKGGDESGDKDSGKGGGEM